MHMKGFQWNHSDNLGITPNFIITLQNSLLSTPPKFLKCHFRRGEFQRLGSFCWITRYKTIIQITVYFHFNLFNENIPPGKDRWRLPLPLVLIYHGPGTKNRHLLAGAPSTRDKPQWDGENWGPRQKQRFHLSLGCCVLVSFFVAKKTLRTCQMPFKKKKHLNLLKLDVEPEGFVFYPMFIPCFIVFMLLNINIAYTHRFFLWNPFNQGTSARCTASHRQVPGHWRSAKTWRWINAMENHPWLILLMAEILHQLRLVVYPIIHDGFQHRWCKISAINRWLKSGDHHQKDGAKTRRK